MKVLVAGATGVVGRLLVPMLVTAGHDVVGTTRDPSRGDAIEAAGARAAVMDALVPEQVAQVVGSERPEVVVHQLTAIGSLDLRHFDRDFALTNRLRTEGTDHLLSAARAAGVRRVVAQGVAGYGAYTRTGTGLAHEDESLETDPPREMRASMAAIRHLDGAVRSSEDVEGVVLRYGVFYGPGTSFAPGGELHERVRDRKFPLVARAGGVWSFLHVADAASAAAAAVVRGVPGAYNVVDDDPAPVAEWLPALAAEIGAREPQRVPRLVGRVFGGETSVVMSTEVRGASNARAARALDWRPAHPTWRGRLTAS